METSFRVSLKASPAMQKATSKDTGNRLMTACGRIRSRNITMSGN
ncbi:unknown [Prevotella sp. CAG:924]|nr:unknown [Prevotella sp. CAG:924]